MSCGNGQDTCQSYMSTESIPLPYCPGCGHTVVVKALDAALVKLQLEPKKVVIVTDIGCIGLADRNFTTSAFHGLHGRSITYACGLKLARPELTVIAIKGDGACGIGGTHLLNVARRNIGITLLVANNFNYGMTGGQHSVTTPAEKWTTTTPWGNVERPMDLCATTAAAGGSWVRRGTVFDKDLSDSIARAITEPGFSMIDVWELCTAYYGARNEGSKKGILDMIEGLGMELGQIVESPRPEYSESYRRSYEQARGKRPSKPKIEVTHSNTIDRQTGVIIAGSAGQKVKTAATLFAKAAIASGLSVTQKDDYPITVMTGHSLAEVILSPEVIDYTGIAHPDHLVIFSEDGLKRVRARIGSMPESTTIYAEETFELPETAATVLRFPFIKTARKVNRLSIGIVAVAAMLERSRYFPMEALSEMIQAFQKPKVAEINLAALAAGRELQPLDSQ